MIACPACRAENKTGPNCRRCKADLSMLFDLTAAHEAHLAAAATALQAGSLEAAIVHLDSAERIRSSPRLKQLRAVVELFRGRFASALGLYLQPSSSK